MNQKIPMAIRLAVMERREKLEAEISDLQQQLQELDDWLAGESGNGLLTAKDFARTNGVEVVPGTSVPRATTPAEPEPETVDVDEPPTTAVKFRADDYTDAGNDLPSEFNLQQLQQKTGLCPDNYSKLINRWRDRKWIERSSHGFYRKTDAFGTLTGQQGTRSGGHDTETRTEQAARRWQHIADSMERPAHDPANRTGEPERRELTEEDMELESEPPTEAATPEEAADISALNRAHALSVSQKRLEDKRAQLSAVIDGSLQSKILKDQIRNLENEILAIQ